jgi:hypothetical protein
LLLLALLRFTGCYTDTHVVMYSAAWCRQCQLDKPLLSGLPVTIVEDETELRRLGIMRLPTYIVFRNGEVECTHDVHRVIQLCRPPPSL